MPKILVVEDDPRGRYLVCEVLRREGDQGCAGINRHGVADERAAQERRAHHFGSESCAWVRKDAGEALRGVHTGEVWSSEITTSVCRPCLDTGKAI